MILVMTRRIKSASRFERQQFAGQRAGDRAAARQTLGVERRDDCLRRLEGSVEPQGQKIDEIWPRP